MLFCFFIFFLSLNKKKNDTSLLDIGGPKVTLVESKKETLKKKVEKTTTPSSTITHLSIEDSNTKTAWKDTTWQPTKTEQTEPHTINFNDGSLDRIEMKKTFSTVLGIKEELLEEWWIGSPNSNEIYGYLTNKENNMPFKVTLTWHKNHGWQAKKVEELYSLPENY